MKQLLVFIAQAALLCLLMPYWKTSAQNNPAGKDDSLARAKELWELALEAKGGREKLYQVKALAISDNSKAFVDFMDLPNKFFQWGDTRPSKLGLVIEMLNFERNFGYTIFASHPDGVHEHDHLSEGIRSRFVEPQFYYLLETRWFKPELLAAYKDRLNGEPVDVVEVRASGFGDAYRYKVFLNEKTHLPARIGIMSNLRQNDMFNWVDLGEYQENAGIKVPTMIRGKYVGRWSKMIVEINPEYDPQVFEREPDPKAGPFQWRRKNKS